jgi:hypothetical protein
MIGKLGVYYLMQLISRELKTTVLFGGIEEWYPNNLSALNVLRKANKWHLVGQAHVENFANLVEDVYAGFLEQMGVEREASVYFVNCTFLTRYYSNSNGNYFDVLGNPTSILRKGTSLALACGVQALFSGYLKNVKRDIAGRQDLLMEDVEVRMLRSGRTVQDIGKGGSSVGSDKADEDLSLESISDDGSVSVPDRD